MMQVFHKKDIFAILQTMYAKNDTQGLEQPVRVLLELEESQDFLNNVVNKINNGDVIIGYGGDSTKPDQYFYRGILIELTKNSLLCG